MRKSIIAAAGGVLAAGFLAIPAPAAHAGPLCPPGPGMTPDKMQQCLNMEQNQARCGVAAGCGGAGGNIMCPPNIDQITGSRGPNC
jgi:hypothetical protein